MRPDSQPSTIQVFAQTLVDLAIDRPLHPVEDVRDELAPLRLRVDTAEDGPAVDVDHGRVLLGRVERVHLEVAEDTDSRAAQQMFSGTRTSTLPQNENALITTWRYSKIASLRSISTLPKIA